MTLDHEPSVSYAVGVSGVGRSNQPCWDYWGLLSGIKKKSFVICSGIDCMKGANADSAASTTVRTDDAIVGISLADFWSISAHFLYSVRTTALISIPPQ